MMGNERQTASSRKTIMTAHKVGLTQPQKTERVLASRREEKKREDTIAQSIEFPVILQAISCSLTKTGPGSLHRSTQLPFAVILPGAPGMS
ncbi:hypothetical protein PG995_011896 [Apiospora arundinis]|uniref:Uncharacterized protein n=1 Tax=Apiospora arundinis TaxID=335852 RepID=A0ABR2HM91_9PEZI